MSESEMASARTAVQRIQQGSYRCFAQSNGFSECYMMMKPGEDGMEDKLFNHWSVLNIYSGLLVSGLMGYVLTPSGRVDGVNELTGMPNRELEHLQIFLSHLNLCASMGVMATSMFGGLCSTCETPLTIVRCVSKSQGLWVFGFIAFAQIFLISAQACLAAILNMDPGWAKLTVSVDVILTVAMVLYMEELHFAMYPIVTDGWVCWLSPIRLIVALIYGRDTQKRIGQCLAAEAEPHLEFKDDHSFGPIGKEDERHEERDKLQVFLENALPHLPDERRGLILSAMWNEDLTLELLKRTALRPHGFYALTQMLDLDAVTTTRGDRLHIANAAADLANEASAESVFPFFD